MERQVSPVPVAMEETVKKEEVAVRVASPEPKAASPEPVEPPKAVSPPPAAEAQMEVTTPQHAAENFASEEHSTCKPAEPVALVKRASPEPEVEVKAATPELAGAAAEGPKTEGVQEAEKPSEALLDLAPPNINIVPSTPVPPEAKEEAAKEEAAGEDKPAEKAKSP